MADTGNIDGAEPTGSLRAKIQPEQLDLLIRQLDSLTDLSPLVTAVLNTRNDQDALAAVLADDPAIDEFRGGLAGVIEAAGLDGARAAAAGVAIRRTLEAIPSAAVERKDFWSASLAVAAAAELIAARLADADPAAAFVCGLLADIGRIALDACLPKSYGRIVEASAEGDELTQLENEIIGVDHALIGRRLAQRWGLPETVQQAIWLHHQPTETVPPRLPGAPLAAIVRLAEALARGMAGGELAERAGLAAAELEAVREELPSRIDYWTGLINTESPASSAPPADGGDAQLRQQNQQLRAQLAGLGRQASALAELARLAGEVSPMTALPALCQRLAHTFALAVPVRVAADRPVCVFAISPEGAQAILAAYDGGREPIFAFADCRRSGTRPSPSAKPAGDVLRSLLDPPDCWSHLIDPDNYTCLPLLSQYRWIGGVLLPGRPGRAEQDEELLAALAAVGGFFLASAVAQAQANRLTEQLAQASQEIARNKDALAQAQALAAVGEMAAGAAHELNNPLAVIAGRAQLLAGQAEDEQDRRAIDLIVRKAEEISGITSELMEFARPRPPQPRAIDPEELLSGAKDAFFDQHDPKTPRPQVDIHIARTCPDVLADGQQLGEVLHELLRNAVTAAEGAAKITMSAGEQDRPQLERPPRVLLRVSDDGPGMDESTVAAAFTPFFSHRPAGRGRGMGLARARRYVQANNGRIWIESSPGKGTDVCIELPPAGSEVKRHE